MSLDSNKIEEIWEKATAVPGYDSARWRQDFAGAWIQREQYGLPTEFGWEIFHLVPVSQGGTSDVDNLYPYASTFPHCSMKSSEYLWPKTKRLVKDERRSKSKLRVCA